MIKISLCKKNNVANVNIVTVWCIVTILIIAPYK